MPTNVPPSLARQLDRCDVCGIKIHRDELVRTQVEFMLGEGSNYIVQSSYDGSHWTTDDDADLGGISLGPYLDNQRLSVAEDGTITELNGAETFSTTKMIYTTVACDDPSSWSSMVFSCEAGPYHRSTTPETVFTFGVYNIGDTANLFQMKSWTTSSQRRIWWTATPSEVQAAGATLSTLGFYIVGTGSSWWADCFQLEKNVTKPGNFIQTSGSTIDRTESSSMTVRKVCPRCIEPILSKSQQFGRPNEVPVAMPVAEWIQEI